MKKKEDSEETFKTTFEQRVNLATSTDVPVFWDCLLPPNPRPNPSPKQETKMEEKPIKIFTQDESRFGTKTVLRRRRITIQQYK